MIVKPLKPMINSHCIDVCYRQDYLKTLDEKFLNLKEGIEPTRFILKGELDWQGSKALMDSQLEIKGKEASFKMGSILDEVRYSLIDIENGQGLEYKCGEDGYTSQDLIAALHAVGIVMELWTALKHLRKDLKKEEETRKK